MPTSQARVQTTEASRYLQQLCRHWSHKFKVEATPFTAPCPSARTASAPSMPSPTPW